MHRRHVTPAAAVLAVVLVTTAGHAQEQAETVRRNSLEPGAWAIQFQITEEIGLKPFNGMMISLKRHFSEGSALRVGVNLNLTYDDTDFSKWDAPSDTLHYSSDSTGKQDGQSLELDLMYMGYPNTRAPVNFFWGTGPLVEYSRAHRESKNVATSQTDTFVQWGETDVYSWEAGLVAAAGVEWFATQGISFHAEYRARATYGASEAEQSSGEDSGPRRSGTAETNSWRFSAVDVVLGLSVYF